MSDTPRTDAAKVIRDRINEPPNSGADSGSKGFDEVVTVEFASQLERELTEALKWKDEDPRMLREQIRISDAAFQRKHEENVTLLTQNAALLEVAKAAYPIHYNADPESGCGCSRCAEFDEAYSNLKQAGVDI